MTNLIPYSSILYFYNVHVGKFVDEIIQLKHCLLYGPGLHHSGPIQGLFGAHRESICLIKIRYFQSPIIY